MNRAAWIDTAIGAAVIGLTAALGVIGAYLAPPGWHTTLYALCIASAALTAAQTLRAVRGALHHERTFAELREGQEYLARPEAHRQFNLIWQRQAGLLAAEDVFQQNFEIDSRDAAATRVRCKVCDWKVEKALLYAREDAVQHFRAWHVPPERRRRFREAVISWGARRA
jgi:hypothetical protein